MEKIILYAIGIMALIYIARRIFRKTQGQGGCSCEEGCCPHKGGCHKID